MCRSRKIIVEYGLGNAKSIAISHKSSLQSHKTVSIVFSSMELYTHQRSRIPMGFVLLLPFYRRIEAGRWCAFST